MSYCPKCGVELAPSQDRCPLCNTPVQREEAAASPYPVADGVSAAPATPRKRRTFAAACAILLLIPVLTCVVCDLNIDGTLAWSRYVLVSFGLLYVYLLMPMVLLRHRLAICVCLDFLATVGFLYGI